MKSLHASMLPKAIPLTVNVDAMWLVRFENAKKEF